MGFKYGMQMISKLSVQIENPIKKKYIICNDAEKAEKVSLINLNYI